MTRLTPFKFENRRGLVVKGTLVSPRGQTASRSRMGFFYLPGIVLGTSAVHRLGMTIARRVAERGHQACLIDHAGIGESEGDHPAGTHRQLTAWVEAGNLVDDTLQAIDAVAEQAGIERVGLIGHCGGAVTSTYAAPRHRAVKGIFLISPPTVAAQANVDELAKPSVADEYFALYLRKLRAPGAWRRLLFGRSDYRQILRTVLGKLHRRTAPNVLSFNPRFVSAFRDTIRQGKSISVVFGDRDPDVEDFRAFQRRHVPPTVSTQIFGETSHGFVTEESMRLLLHAVDRFSLSMASGA